MKSSDIKVPMASLKPEICQAIKKKSKTITQGFAKCSPFSILLKVMSIGALIDWKNL